MSEFKSATKAVIHFPEIPSLSFFFPSSLLLHLLISFHWLCHGTTSLLTVEKALERWTQGNSLLLSVLFIFLFPL